MLAINDVSYIVHCTNLPCNGIVATAFCLVLPEAMLAKVCKAFAYRSALLNACAAICFSN